MTLDEITRCIDRQPCQFIVPIIASDDRLQPGCVGRVGKWRTIQKQIENDVSIQQHAHQSYFSAR